MKLPIHIVTEDYAAFERNYVIVRLASHWQAWGHSVTSGPAKMLETEFGIMHINKTRIDVDEVPVTSHRQLLLNRQVLDISKRTFSALRVYPEDAWDGPVMVKSNLNSFGNPERRLRRPGIFNLMRRQIARRHWQLVQMLPPNDYPVLPRISAVPAWVWEREDLLVERFMPEKQGDSYSIRGWLFFGERGYNYRLFSRSPMVKTRNITHYEILKSVPPELDSFRRANHFDFGKFDYVEVGGQIFIIDMNKTPTTIAKPDSPRLKDLAEGIYDYIDRRRS